ncbi:InlB B-repeat-containing protein, partial [Faecalicoccus pleomorphus]|uniref:InlB B-repeat-containing protein n=1 Tax=Faecalicoccus pleomorphus TaxID=1323 RepID=UPI001961C426
MLKHVRRGAALILSMAMFIQLGIGNNYITFASEESQTPEQTQEETGTTPETTGEVPEESSNDATGTQESTEPAPKSGNNEATVPDNVAASTLVVQFVNEDKTNIDVNQYPDKEIALTDLYVNDPYQLVFNDYQINTEIEGYTLSKIVDANDAQKEYPLTTMEQGYVDITLSQNITKLQLVYTKNPEPVQQPDNSQTETDSQQPSEEQEESSEEDGQQEEQPKEDTEAVKEETESEEVSMPEQVLSAVASDGATITIMAPKGSVPEKSTVVAEPVENDSIAQSIEDALNEEDKTLNEYKAYDITILDKDGNEIQPEKDVQVSITGVSVSGEEKAVFHIDDSNKVEKVSDTSVGATTLFSAESFSIYVVAGANQGNAGQSTSHKYTMEVGQQITLAEEDLNTGGNWSVNNKGRNVVKILNASGGSFLDRTNPSAVVTAIGSGDAEITYEENNWHGWDDSSTFYIHVDERDGNYTITFKANGGQGKDCVWETEETNITLPEPKDIEITNEGKTFIGWSEDKTGKGNTYVANIQYPSTSDGMGQLNRDVTLYAIWLDEDAVATEGVTAYFYIRKDGEIQWEPAGYGTDLYYPTGSAKSLKGKLKQPIAVNNNLAAVEANLAEIPSNQDIIDVLKQYGVNYNPKTQTIQWYVIKARADEPGYWNVDGVIVNKEEHLVTYHPNGGTTEVPGSLTYVAGTNVDVNFDRIPTRAGYDFIGWDKDKNARTPTYTQNGTRNFNMPDEDVTLYAIWKERTDTKFTVEHYIQQYDGTYRRYDFKEEAGTTGSTVKDDDYKLEDFEFEGQKYTYSPGAVDDITEAKVDAEGNTVLKLYYNLVSERKDYDDEIISTGDNTDDSEDELMQGKINIEVYLDGTLHHKGEVKFKYYQHNAVDLYVNCDNNYYLNAIYAIQTDVPSLAKDITATSVDNVEGDTTVYIYVTSKYTAKYTLDGVDSSIIDNNEYTIPNYGTRLEINYSVYKNDSLEGLSKIDLKGIPDHFKTGYKYDGWYIGNQKFNDTDEFDVSENHTLAKDNEFVFDANTVPEARNVTVNYIDDQDPANELKASETVPTEYDAEYNV